MSLPIEVCIECGDLTSVRCSVENALAGGAKRIELCANMTADGLTPNAQDIRVAREVFGSRRGVLAMIRPRVGNFCYSNSEIETMTHQILMAAKAGADGVVLGVLKGDQIDEIALDQLLAVARHYDLSISFHRAFDDITDKHRALELLIDKKVQYVLTCGAPLNSGLSALEGVADINSTLEHANGRIEVVVGGGIRCDNVQILLGRLARTGSAMSVHSYSGLLDDGLTASHLVKDMVNSA